MQVVNKKTLEEIAQKSPTSEAFFAYAGCRKRAAREGITSIPWIKDALSKEGFLPVPQELLAMFRELDRAGVGKLKGDKFSWDLPITRLAEALEGPKAETGLPRPPVVVVSEEPKPVTAERLVVCFGKDKEITVNFTSNLTKADVEFAMQKLLKEVA